MDILGTRDSGLGTRDSGLGDSGLGTRDSGTRGLGDSLTLIQAQKWAYFFSQNFYSTNVLLKNVQGDTKLIVANLTKISVSFATFFNLLHIIKK